VFNNIKEYLFLKLTLQSRVMEQNPSVRWINRDKVYSFDVGKSYLPYTILVSPYPGISVETENGRFNLKENSAMILAENEPFWVTYKSPRNSECLFLFLGTDSFENYNSFFPHKRIMRNEALLNCVALRFMLEFEHIRHNKMYLDELHEYFTGRMLDISQETIREMDKLDFKKSSTRREVYSRLSRSAEYMEDMYNRNISLDELAKEANISKYHYLRSFKKLFNVTPCEYLSNIRITRAKNLLAETSSPVSEISFQLGFENTSHFSVNFKKITGYSPLRFRRRHKKSNII